MTATQLPAHYAAIADSHRARAETYRRRARNPLTSTFQRAEDLRRAREAEQAAALYAEMSSER